VGAAAATATDEAAGPGREDADTVRIEMIRVMLGVLAPFDMYDMV
jgi:hypothetical protein